MNTAVVSVKGCVCFVGILAICIVFAILFLQERERVYASLEKWKIFGNLIHIIREMAAGIKAYLKAQFKIIFVVCLLCVGGLWALKVRHYVGFGVAIGMFDAFPVLGTGTFSYSGGAAYVPSGENKNEHRLACAVSFDCGSATILRTEAYRKSCRCVAAFGTGIGLLGSGFVWWFWICFGTCICFFNLCDFEGMCRF